MTTEVNNYNQTKSITVICCTVVREWPHPESFKFLWQFLLILQHLLMRYVWNHCDQAADMVWIAPFCWDYQMDLSFAIHKAALLKLEGSSHIVSYWHHFFPILLNLMQKIEYFVPYLGHYWPYLAQLKSVFLIKFSQIGRLQNLNRKNIELFQV